MQKFFNTVPVLRIFLTVRKENSREEISLRGLHGRELEDAILRGILQKPKGHHLTEHASDTPRTMNEIGG